MLVVFMLGTIIPAWGQASTEGREFWVALNMTTGTGGDDHEPFICITTQHPGGSYTITNPTDPNFTPITGLIPAKGYVKIESNTNPSSGQINLSQWYPVGQTAQTMSNQIADKGLKITTTVDCSVFAGNRMPQSFDAANILPITALQTEYITQDYPGYDHEDKGGGYPVTTILATENGTQVTFIPSSAVLTSNGTSTTTATITKTLNAGQVLYLTGDNRASLSGSIVRSNKKIAVFTGVNNTDVPGPVSARDHLYEQNMPVDYWGTHFVVTRSMKKDANRIRVTASNNGTTLTVDGTYLTTINAGETYEFELCSATMRQQSAYTKAAGEHRGTDKFFEGEAHYLETSCPCAVFSYDVSEKYYIDKDGTSERDPNAAGDPSMVWISPLEQQLRKVTFGVMNTDQTTTHYVNIITPTSGASSLEVREVSMNAGQVVYGNNLVNPSDVKPVPGKQEYSYARIKLTDNAENVYTITSGVGFIAHVYGSGNKESYAYSCGSAAVQRGVRVNDEIFSDGYRSDSKYCLEDVIHFNAGVGTDEINRVVWNFGDGTTADINSAETDHQYLSPGWFDVTATLYGHQVCSNESDMELGSVQFSFRVVKRDTIMGEVEYRCLSLDTLANDPERRAYLLQYGENDTIVPDLCSEPVKINYLVYGEEKRDTVNQYDSAYVNGDWYYYTQDIVYTPQALPGQQTCDVHCHIHIIQCLGLTFDNVPEDQHICPGSALKITYSKTKGDIGGLAHMVIPGMMDETVFIDNLNTTSNISLPTHVLQKPGIYHATLIVPDLYCDTLTFPVDLTVKYPSDIFERKFNNVLAVYTKDFNGGYSFTHYEWHLIREGLDTIIGGDESIYHQDMPFMQNDTVYVVLTDNNGLTLPSCIQVWENDPYDWPESEQQNAPAAQKEIRNQRMYIRIEDRVYDMYGQRIE